MSNYYAPCSYRIDFIVIHSCIELPWWKNHSVEKVLLAIWEIFIHENNRNYNSYRFSHKFAFILFLVFLTIQKQELCFQQVGGQVAKNISVFCLQRVALYFKAMSNSIDFYKGIFLLSILVRILVPCSKVTVLKNLYLVSIFMSSDQTNGRSIRFFFHLINQT